MVESSSPSPSSSSSSFSAAAPSSSDTLEIAALKVLYAEDPWTKAEYGDVAARLWLDGSIKFPYLHDSALPPVPRRPARLPTVQLVAPRDMPKLGKGGSLRSRQALLHSLVHTESWAIDLSWDIIARFGKAESMPREFFDDFVKVAQDEGRHFQLLATRLGELGSSYGALPAHDGLWDSAEATAHDLSARLVVEHCVHEARGLDVLPTTISRFRKGGDDLTADLLESVIYPEEITHCAAGVRWFTFLCLQSDPMTCLTTSLCSQSQGTPSHVIAAFHLLVRKYFRGPLKPPFNRSARAAAGFGPEWYEPLTMEVPVV
ncbi:unnamed protein product [Sphagnum compactum]